MTHVTIVNKQIMHTTVLILIYVCIQDECAKKELETSRANFLYYLKPSNNIQFVIRLHNVVG